MPQKCFGRKPRPSKAEINALTDAEVNALTDTDAHVVMLGVRSTSVDFGVGPA